MRREEIAWSHYHPHVSARTRFELYRRQGNGADGYLVVEQCLADGFRGSRCGRGGREWRRLVGHCAMD